MEAIVQAQADIDLAKTASQKLASGALMKLTEVAAILDVAPATVHVLPLPTIKVGRQYRFDPKDVSRFIAEHKEVVL